MKKILILVGIWLYVVTASAQFVGTEIDAILEKNKKMLGEYAMAMIYKDGNIIYKKKIGENFDEKTQTPIGTGSRWLTAALVMQFVDEGKITLESKIADYLPEFHKYGKRFITIRHCLTDLTGIEAKKWSVNDQGKFNTLEEMVNSYARKEIRANAGTDCWFGDYGANIAARVLEVITKKGFEQLMAQKLLRPLGMKNTSFAPEGGYCVNAGAGALSTMNDYMSFLKMLMNKGTFNGKPILSAQAVEQLLTIQVPSSVPKVYLPKDSEGFEIGLGNFIFEKNAEDKATVVGCPNFMGFWPIIDLCRNYACIVLPANYLVDAKRNIYQNVKSTIDNQLTSTCN